MTLTVVQPVDAEGLPVAFRVALEQELGVAHRALFARGIEHAQDVVDREFVVGSCVSGASRLPVLDHVALQPRLDQGAVWGRLESRRDKGALYATGGRTRTI